jgi:hypothetical protein
MKTIFLGLCILLSISSAFATDMKLKMCGGEIQKVDLAIKGNSYRLNLNGITDTADIIDENYTGKYFKTESMSAGALVELQNFIKLKNGIEVSLTQGEKLFVSGLDNLDSRISFFLLAKDGDNNLFLAMATPDGNLLDFGSDSTCRN